MRFLITTIISSAVVLFSAASASAYATSIDSPSAGENLEIGDLVEIDMTFDTEGEADVTLISVGILFDDTIWAYRDDLFTAPTYALYATPSKGAIWLVPAATNGQLRVGTTDQSNGDWLTSGLPDGNRDPGSFSMGTFSFEAIANGQSDFIICNDCPGNILQLGDGSNPPNNISGDFTVTVPEAGAVAASAAALLTLAMIRTGTRRR